MKPKTYKSVMEEFVERIMNDSSMALNHDERRDNLLCGVIITLAVIADILDERNVNVKAENRTDA